MPIVTKANRSLALKRYNEMVNDRIRQLRYSKPYRDMHLRAVRKVAMDDLRPLIREYTKYRLLIADVVSGRRKHPPKGQTVRSLQRKRDTAWAELTAARGRAGLVKPTPELPGES